MDRAIVASEAWEFALAWDDLMDAIPDRERWPQVRITLRRKTGQVMCAVERVQRTGRTPAEAVRNVAAALRA
jgi:hypothetical protein